MVAGKSADSLLTFEDQYIVLGEDEAEKHQLEEKVLKSTDLLSNKLREAVRMRDEYINELQTTNNSNDVADSIEIMRRMQHDDIEKASRLMVIMAREMQTTVHEKKSYYAVEAGLGIWKCNKTL
ncbi:hypothetical protein Tco_0232691 [Tanacetum coccineum]